ncbi:MAG: XrtA/PEP-CTERM system histidine kinase PrsK [Gammaproteobacteria bacterium]
MTIGYYGYLSAALGFGFFAVLLLFSWRSSVEGKLLTAVVLCTALWALLAMTVVHDGRYPPVAYQVFEVMRYVFWYLFLLKLFEPAARQIVGHSFLQRHMRAVAVGFGLIVILIEMVVRYVPRLSDTYDISALGFMGHVLLAVIGLSIIEQLYRNLAVNHRHMLKYLFIGAGVIFAFDFYLYTNAAMFKGLDRELWEARGFINLFTVPLLALSAARNKDWSPNIFISRDIVLHTTAIVGSGLYLLVMAAAGYYLQEYGGSWGRVAKIAFFTLAAIFLIAVLFSVQIRRQLRVFLGKHFYRNKYDYRVEWLSLTRALSETGGETGRYETAIRVLGQLVDARAGLLWLCDERGVYSCMASWGAGRIDTTEPADSSLVRFLGDNGYVINLLELAERQDEYSGLKLPAWLADIEQGWLIVPLPGTESLLGFVVLARPLVARDVNWEDRDLLKTAARQVAGHLAVIMTSDALAQAKQFEVFNRLSSYMVHDLKNIAAGLEMVAKNAVRHRDNPEFLSDAFDSVSAAATDIKRLLEQLRSKKALSGKNVLIELPALLQDVVTRRSSSDPVPVLELADGVCRVTADQQRLENVLIHLVENAQQATTAQGYVRIGLRRQDPVCVVDIRDDGHGMDDDFIRNRLFKPFDTTKGNAGMGIGMYESREFIRELGGEINVSSSPGNGATVTLYLPAAQDDRNALPVDA